MSVPRLLAIGFIFCCTVVAWFTLGVSVVHRTGESDSALAEEVAKLWGGHHLQRAPEAWYEQSREVMEDVLERDGSGNYVTRKVTKTVIDRIPVPLSSSLVEVDLGLTHRKKGLLWYDTYTVAFDGRYAIRNGEEVPRDVFVRFSLPSAEASYDAFRFTLDGRPAPPINDISAGLVERVTLDPGAETPLTVSYRSRGLGDWTYGFGPDGVAQVHDFQLTMRTDFAGIDFPPGTMSPSEKSFDGRGHTLAWKFESLVTGQRIGMDLPNKLNPGPVAARITFFAPVSLLFFLTTMVMLGALRAESLHPMNYFFVAAAFFSFHLLLAYLVDHLNVHASFAIASATSLGLVVTYLRLVTGLRRALVHAGAAQLVFLVMFSTTFFFEGYTGLTITIGSIVTLFLMMQLTGRVDWEKVLGRSMPQPSPRGGGVSVDLCLP